MSTGSTRGAGTREDPWTLSTPPGKSEYQAYRDEVLPPEISARVSVEAASTIGWDRYVGATGEKIGMHGFGASAPIADLLKKFGFTREAVLAAARRQFARA